MSNFTATNEKYFLLLPGLLELNGANLNVLVIKHFKLFRARGHWGRGRSSKLTCSFLLFFFFLTVHQIIQINLCIWFAEAHIWIVEWGKLSFFSRTAIKTKTHLSKLNVLIRKGKLKSYYSAFWFLQILGLSEVSCHLNRLGWVKNNENSEFRMLWPFLLAIGHLHDGIILLTLTRILSVLFHVLKFVYPCKL